MAAAGTFQQVREDVCYSSGNIIPCAVKVNSEILVLPEQKEIEVVVNESVRI